MNPRRRNEFPDDIPVGLRCYVPALRYAVRLAREREQELTAAFEPQEHRLASQSRAELEELREMIEAVGG